MWSAPVAGRPIFTVWNEPATTKCNTRDFTRLFVVDYRRKGATYNIIDILHR